MVTWGFGYLWGYNDGRDDQRKLRETPLPDFEYTSLTDREMVCEDIVDAVDDLLRSERMDEILDMGRTD